jgi:hypothetical protein
MIHLIQYLTDSRPGQRTGTLRDGASPSEGDHAMLPQVPRHLIVRGSSGLRLEAVDYRADPYGARALQRFPGAVPGPGLKPAQEVTLCC